MSVDGWNGFKLPMGFFVVWKDNQMRFGKCHPITKEVIEWFELEEVEKICKMSYCKDVHHNSKPEKSCDK